MNSPVKRSIRLKEFLPNIERIHIPSKDYLGKINQIEPNQLFFQRTDEYGFTKSHINFSGEKKVIILGDSFIESIFVDESKRITSIVEELLLTNSKKIEVINSGVSGATGLGLLNCILNKIVPLKPDMIIFSQPSCDFSALLYENGYFNDSNFFSNILPSKNTENFTYETIEENLLQLKMVIELLVKICNIYNIKLCLSTCCSNSSKRQLKMMNDIIRDNKHLGYDIIDLDIDVPKGDLYFYDKQHLNAKGSEHIGKIYFDYINKNTLNNNKFLFERFNITFIEELSVPVSDKIKKFLKLSNCKVSVSFKIKNHSNDGVCLKLNIVNSSNQQLISEFYLNANCEIEMSYSVEPNESILRFAFVGTKEDFFSNIEIKYFNMYIVSDE